MCINGPCEGDFFPFVLLLKIMFFLFPFDCVHLAFMSVSCDKNNRRLEFSVIPTLELLNHYSFRPHTLGGVAWPHRHYVVRMLYFGRH